MCQKKRESEGKRHFVEQQKGQKEDGVGSGRRGGGVADVTFFFSG